VFGKELLVFLERRYFGRDCDERSFVRGRGSGLQSYLRPVVGEAGLEWSLESPGQKGIRA